METLPLPAAWYLEGFADEGGGTWRTIVRGLPFCVGRSLESDLVLLSRRVSQQHAVLYAEDDQICLRDLGSTNGTFVNGRRLAAAQPLTDGDVVHFGDREFRLVACSGRHAALSTQAMTTLEIELLAEGVDRARRFREMLADRRLHANFQPMVRLADRAVLGYELLGRGQLAETDTSTAELFLLAEHLGLAHELSRAFRQRGMEDAGQLPGDPLVFLNTHPVELVDPGELLGSLRTLRERFPERGLVLEIHEAAVADLDAFQELRNALRQLCIGIAFDDFGTGQTRLLELIEIAPQYVKFDRTWIQDLHHASRRRCELVTTLVRMLAEMEVATVAEGVECEGEAVACADLGFDHAQGYYFGRPAPAAVFI